MPTGANRHKQYEKDRPDQEYIHCPAHITGNIEDCPLKMRHPPNGVEFGMGCTLCNDEKQKKKDEERMEDNRRNRDIIELLTRMKHPQFAPGRCVPRQMLTRTVYHGVAPLSWETLRSTRFSTLGAQLK